MKCEGLFFEFFVFDKLLDEFPAGIFLSLFFFVIWEDGFWKEHAAFDEHEGCGHDEEFAGEF